MKIRRALRDERDALNVLMWNSSWQNEADRPFLSENRDLVRVDDGLLNQGQVFVAEIEGKVVGFASWLDTDIGIVIDDLFTAPAHFRKGIAIALVGQIFSEQCDLRDLPLFADVNPNAMAFYVRAGFTVMTPAPNGTKGVWMKLDPKRGGS